MKSTLSFVGICLFVFILINGCSKSDDSITNTPNGNQYPTTPSSPTPSNGAINVSGFVTATWLCSDPDDGDTVRYDVVAGLSNPPSTTIISNTLNRSADIGVGAANTTYYWRVTAKDNRGGTTVGPIWSYKTAP